ncbi:class II aldolase/adducin family protein [Lysinibacillus agricola]|uniref:Class II aldolase/adducin family protein n=1 Tax=Lysinibacillus agricola TaxID=2590012 RepID=A0ABX7AT70_9BACI|nr:MULTISPECIES: class II aldolase/adducin family protein [Lysinibacillus]KOS64526.1 aldolase [Lysinibacillus sp. FJAT-14222]QQP12727.1 class II aldolase/adducin family protein [Lysinibacillus agricola]
MNNSEQFLKEQICDIGKRMYMKDMGAANDGNISIKISENSFLCTPTGVSKGFMTPDMICKINSQGEVIEENLLNTKPSSEIKMHLRVYQERPDVTAVVHAHPLYATAFAICGIPLNKQIMPESTIFLGEVPIAEYGTPSTEELPNSIVPYLQNHDAILLANHGALTCGIDLMSAYFKMESMEFYAKLLYLTSVIGEPKELTNEQVTTLVHLREKKFKVPGRFPDLGIHD